MYHVSPDGDDGNSGTISAPISTIQRGTDLARAGDTVLVRAGIYRETVIMRFSGEPGKPIVLKNYPGEQPVIQPGEPGEQPPGHGVQLWAAEGYQNPIGWIAVEGFEIRYAWDGVKLNNAHDVEIRRCRIHDSFNQGILGNGNRVLIDGNVIASNDFKEQKRENQQHGVYCTGTAFTITNNIIHSNRAYGITVAAYEWREGYAGQEYSGARDWLIANNVFAFNKHRAGIVIWMSLTRNCVVQNNIFYENGGVNGVFFSGQQGKKHPVRNNIFYPSGGSLVSWEEDAYRAVDNLEVDPGFVDAESFDFRLRADSPAIDAGIDDRYPARDFTGASRPGGTQVDIGAYEFVEKPTAIEDSGSRSALPEWPTLLGNYPNPFNSSTRICFALPRTSAVSLELFNVAGQRLRTLIDGRVARGYHEIVWDGLDASGKVVVSGVYLASVRTDGWRDIGRMVLIR